MYRFDERRGGIVFWAAFCVVGLVVARAHCEEEYAFFDKWGSEGSGPGQFDLPTGVAVDAEGYVYVVDYGNNRVQKFTFDGQYVLEWGEYGTGDGQFVTPWGNIAVAPDGTIYVPDPQNHRIQRFTSDGQFITKWGTHGTGGGEFDYCSSVVVDSAGNVYVADYYNDRVQKFTADGTFLTMWYGGVGGFGWVTGLGIGPSDEIYAMDGWARVQKFKSNGDFLLSWGEPGSGDGQFEWFYWIIGLATDGVGNVFVPDERNYRIQKFTSEGQFLTKWGTAGSGDGEFDKPECVAVDALGFVYVTDTYNNRIQVFAPPVPPENTSVGTDVAVDAGGGVTVTFGEVTSAGNTLASSSPDPPSGSPTSAAFRLLEGYWDIATTAVYSPGVTLEIPYDDSGLSVEEEAALVLLHYDEALQQWADVTVLVNVEDNVVVGFSSGLSVFAIAVQEMRPTWVPPLHGGTSAAAPDGPFKRRRTIPVKFRLVNPTGQSVTDAEAESIAASLSVFYEAPRTGGPPPLDPGDEPPDAGGDFRYDASDDLFIYNLSTKDPSWLSDFIYRLNIIIDGHVGSSAYFSLR